MTFPDMTVERSLHRIASALERIADKLDPRPDAEIINLPRTLSEDPA